MVRNRRLIRNFLKSARNFLAHTDNNPGEIHVTSKTSSQYMWWEIPELCTGLGPLIFLRKFPFNSEHFVGYQVRNVEYKKPFPLIDCTTFVFGFKPQSDTVTSTTSTTTETSTNVADTPTVPSLKYYCADCKKKMSGEKPFIEHMDSKAHKAKSEIEKKWRIELESENNQVQ